MMSHRRSRHLRLAVFPVIAAAFALAGCGAGHNDDDNNAVVSGISQECGVAPQVPVCEMAVCNTETGRWDTQDRPAGVFCNVTGTCDGNGNCIMPPPPPPPSCDNPPPPRYSPGVNGNYPHGADVLTCSRPSAGVEAWHIEYPSVDRATTDYPVITFNAGDSITISASGCVQTGGHGSTWKRYVDPDNGGGHLDGQYFGTLLIPGVTGNSPAQAIEHWIGPPFVTPIAGHLVLGYVDDGLGDNGYYARNDDNGINNQCVNILSKVTLDVTVNHNQRTSLSCDQWNSAGSNPVVAGVPELSQIATLLTNAAEVPLGLPVTADATATGVSHFQLFQDGAAGQTTTLSNRNLNSAELHPSDGCVYVAYTPLTAPIWYPVDQAWDKDDPKSWQIRPWDPTWGGQTFGYFEDRNRDKSQWLSTFVPGTCNGAGSVWRWTSPRWMKVCPPQLPPDQWTEWNTSYFPRTDPDSWRTTLTGAFCGWQIKQPPNLSDDCVSFDRAEWVNTLGGPPNWFETAEGIVTNSFLSGGDWSGDHNGMASNHYIGVHSDPLTHTDVNDCPSLANVAGGEHCADWELNLLPDPNYRHLLAANESQLNDRDGGDCKAKHAEYRLGNDANDLRGALGIEGEQWYYPFGFRPEPGDRTVVRGSWIIDCGHPDWHTELHPASLLQSSYLQRDDYAPVEGATWNRPPRLTNNWRSITGGTPATITKVILSPVFAEASLSVDIWPPPRPCAGARLMTTREDLAPNAAWSGVNIVEETPLPNDGNANHLHVTFTRSPFTLQFGGDGDVQNPDSNLTFFTAYMAWWNTDGVVCPAAGGPGSGPPPVPGGGGCDTSSMSNMFLVAGAMVIAGADRRRRNRTAPRRVTKTEEG